MNQTRPSRSWQRVWVRSWMLACLMFLGLELWTSAQHFSIRSEMQGTPRLLGALCGVVLFVSSLAFFARNWRLACWGLLVSLLAMSLALLPVIAYN